MTAQSMAPKPQVVVLTEQIRRSNGLAAYGGFEINNGSFCQRVFLGDFFAYKSEKKGKLKIAPFQNEMWLIGQVIALRMSKTGSNKKYEVTVKRFAFLSSTYCDDYASKESKNTMKGLCRPNHSIIETQIEETIPIERLLPAVVKLESPDFFTKRNQIPPEIQVPGTYTIFYCPLGFLDPETKSFERRHLDHYIGKDGELPGSLSRGWTNVDTEQRQLESVFKEAIIPLRKTGHFMEVSPRAIASRIQWKSKTPEGTQTSDLDEKHKPKLPNITKDDDKRKSKLVDSGRPSKRPKSQVGLSEASFDEATITTLASVSTTKIDTRARVDQLFPKKPLYTLRSKGKKGKAAAERYFFESVDLLLCKQNYDSCIRGRISGKFTFHIGDVVAISTLAEAPPHRTKKPWMPFTSPWAAAQVLAIYRKENLSSGQIFVDFRYLYRLSDIDLLEDLHLPDIERRRLFENKHSARMVIEIDEFVGTVLAEAVLGKVEITSDPKPSMKWLNRFIDDGKHPQVPLLCRHFYQSKTLAASLNDIFDWSTFKERIAGPLSRGLLCEKAQPGKDPVLRMRYLDAMKRRLGLSDEIEDGLSSNGTQHSDTVINNVPTRWPMELMNIEAYIDDTCLSIYTEPLMKGKSINFFSSALVPFVPRRCVSRATANKATVCSQFWKIKIGDIVSVAWDAANAPRSDRIANPWYPFVAPWRIGQVTCIYNETTIQSPGSDEPLVELCMFERHFEMPSNALSWMPQTTGPITEIFHSNCFERDVKASRILGVINLFVASHRNKVCCQNFHDVPTVDFRCKYLFLNQFCRFQPLFSTESNAEGWFRCMTLKSFWFSPTIQRRKALFYTLKSSLTDNEVCPLSSRGSSSAMFHDDFCENVLLYRQEHKRSERCFYFCHGFTPSWDKYALSDVMFPDSDREGLRWVGCVGDIVAVHNTQSTAKNYDFPYSVPWKAGQIVSIFQIVENSSGNIENKCMVEIRWLLRVASVSTLSQTNDLGILYEHANGHKNETEVVECDSVIGPIAMFTTNVSELQQHDKDLLWSYVKRHSHIPVSIHVYGGEYDTRIGAPVRNGQNNSRRIRTLLRRCVEASTQYSQEIIEEIFAGVTKAINDRSKIPGTIQPHMKCAALSDENTSVSVSSSTFFADSNAWLPEPPFHVDHGANCEFYKEACIRPRYGIFCTSLTTPSVSNNSIWKIQLGDVLIVRHSYGSGRTPFGEFTEHPNSSKHFPLANDVKWAVAEIVAIIRRRSPEDDLKPSISFEIRWLYRASELKGVDIEKDPTWHIVEEVLESDHYDEISPCTLLAPAELVSNAKVSEAKYSLGMPVVQFQCRRFWSPRRQSLVPVGDLRGRTVRARVHSKYSKELELLSRIENENHLQHSLLPSSSRNGEWKDSFEHVIKKLSLAEASAEGFERSTALIGRQDEQKAIKSFLQSSILGKGQDENKASFFVGGPPGVGKTSSIWAAISDLKREQTEGKIPSFDFVSLNGMEMRNPNEAYTKFLEKICRSGKTYNSDTARKQLIKYFEKSNPKSESEPSKIVVLLLDEIDYLVTPQEDILYDFFNWPATSRSVGAPFQLVLIGISNTLDLLDRLHHRVQSRIGQNHLSFAAYDAQQTVAILTAKITQASPIYKVFKEDAIMFASKKTSMASGDIRKAFHICKTAAELVLEQHDGKSRADDNPVVMVKDIVAAVQKNTSSAEFKCIEQCAPFEALLLISLAVLRKTTGLRGKGFDVEEIIAKMEHLAKSSGNEMYLPPPTLRETLGLINRLADCQLISVGTPERKASISFRSVASGCGGFWPMVYTDAEDTTLISALKNSPHGKLVIKYLANSAR